MIVLMITMNVVYGGNHISNGLSSAHILLSLGEFITIFVELVWLIHRSVSKWIHSKCISFNSSALPSRFVIITIVILMIWYFFECKRECFFLWKTRIQECTHDSFCFPKFVHDSDVMMNEWFTSKSITISSSDLTCNTLIKATFLH